jgi:hypothetical protein
MDGDIVGTSAPVPSGGLAEYQREHCYALIDDRYSAVKPVWIAVDATGRKDLEQRLRTAVVQRLIDAATVVRCNWRSHRRTLK